MKRIKMAMIKWLKTMLAPPPVKPCSPELEMMWDERLKPKKK